MFAGQRLAIGGELGATDPDFVIGFAHWWVIYYVGIDNALSTHKCAEP